MIDLNTYLFHHQWIIYLAILWMIPWKMITLWQAAQRKQKTWFSTIFFFNTLAVLPIIYLFIHRKKKN